MPSRVLLTGGNGFIAVHILSLLLSLDHSVVTTVRSEIKTTYLRQKFSDALGKGQLRFAIVEDIIVPGAFDEVLMNNSFDVVIHTSGYCGFDAKNIIKDLLNPAILGTTEILKATKAHGPTVKRVVITSSFAAMLDVSKGDRPGYVYSEKDWSPITYEEAQRDPILGYLGSKTLAEKAAWDFMRAEKPEFTLTTICPPMTYGPAIQEVTSMSNLNSTSNHFYDLFSGKRKELMNFGTWLWVDVRSVAEAHVAAFEKPEAANERFFICGGRFNASYVAKHIWEYYPERARAKGIAKPSPSAGFPEKGTYLYDNTKSKTILGIKYIPFEATIKDALDQFVALEKKLGAV